MTHPAVVNRKPGSITFRVDDVEPAKDLLPETKTHEGIAKVVGSRVESACDYTSEVVAGVERNALVHAVHLAFATHRPLVLSPDMVWLTLVQGFAHHVAANAEELRPRLVSHEGKKLLVVQRPDFVRGSPENPWAEVFRSFGDAIRADVKPEGYALVVERFSTTGPVVQAAYEIALMDAYAPFFSFGFVVGCGIPTVTLEGTEDDWSKIATKAARFQDWGLGWWTEKVLPILDNLARAAAGDVDVPFWRDIYKLKKAYGADILNGWFCKLFPYLADPVTGRATRKNVLVTEDEGIRSTSFPTGISQVPFTWKDRHGERRMDLLAGVVGVTQDRTMLALRPKIGWAVREASEMDQVLLRLSRHETRPPLGSDEVAAILMKTGGGPGELMQLYLHCDGVKIRDQATGKVVATIYPIAEVRERHFVVRLGELADGTPLGLVYGRGGYGVFAYDEKDLPPADERSVRWPPLPEEKRKPLGSLTEALGRFMDEAGGSGPSR
jgi:hypothetical protein